MKTLKIEYSEEVLSALNLSAESFEQEARRALAVKLYEIGRLTSGQAATLTALSRAEFLLACNQYGAATVRWDNDELETEFGNANR